MLNKGENVPVAVSEHFRGGEGEVWLKDLTCGRKPPNVKVFSEMTLHKGCSVGYLTPRAGKTSFPGAAANACARNGGALCIGVRRGGRLCVFRRKK